MPKGYFFDPVAPMNFNKKRWRLFLIILTTLLAMIAAVVLNSEAGLEKRKEIAKIVKVSIVDPSHDTFQPPLSFRVTKATLRANPAEYIGPCPVEIKFNAKISVTGGEGKVVFQILRSDNVPAPAVTIVFPKSGSRDTTYSWHPNENFLGWHQIKIKAPNEIESNRVDISVQCQ